MQNESDKRLNLVHDMGMKPIMNITTSIPWKQVKQFLIGINELGEKQILAVLPDRKKDQFNL
jgi:hypothetical protein